MLLLALHIELLWVRGSCQVLLTKPRLLILASKLSGMLDKTSGLLLLLNLALLWSRCTITNISLVLQIGLLCRVVEMLTPRLC